MTFRRFLPTLIALVFASFATAPASAVPLNVDITGYYNASFVIDGNPTPDFADASHFVLKDISVTSGGATEPHDILFRTSDGLSISKALGPFSSVVVFDGVGAVLFSGTTSNPQIETGVYELFSSRVVVPTFSTTNSDPFKSVVSITAAVPLPAALPMLAAGLAGLGLMTRKRRLKSLPTDEHA